MPSLGAMPKPEARACFSTAHEHGRATLGHGTQLVRTHQDTSDRALIYAFIGCFIAGLPWAGVAYDACTVETNLNTVAEQAVVTIGIGLAL
jgi:hypothetical protein